MRRRANRSSNAASSAWCPVPVFKRIAFNRVRAVSRVIASASAAEATVALSRKTSRQTRFGRRETAHLGHNFSEGGWCSAKSMIVNSAVAPEKTSANPARTGRASTSNGRRPGRAITMAVGGAVDG